MEDFNVSVALLGTGGLTGNKTDIVSTLEEFMVSSE